MRLLACGTVLGLALAGCGSAAANQASLSPSASPIVNVDPPLSALPSEREETLVELAAPPPIPGKWLIGVPLGQPRLTVGGDPLDALRWSDDGVFQVIEERPPLVRVVVERPGVELWLWVNAVESTGPVTKGRTVLHAAIDGPPIGVVTGGLAFDVADSKGPMNARLLFEVLSSWVEVEGWLPPDNASRVFRRESPPMVEGREVELAIPYGQEVTITAALDGAPIARVHQGIAAFRAIVRGSPKQGQVPISLLIESWEGPREGELLARIDGYIAVEFLPKATDASGLESDAPAPVAELSSVSGPGVAGSSTSRKPGSCLVDPVSQQTVGRIVDTVQWRRDGLTISIDGLDLEVAEGRPCPSPLQNEQ